DGQKYETIEDMENHTIAVEKLLSQLSELGIIEDFSEITGVGHRVVAGGEHFKESTVIDDDVLAKIEELAEFAPLHNPANAMGIKAFKKILPDIVSVAVFDTSFHTTMPKKNYLYSLPMEYYEKHNARRYGAHGTSHRYVAHRAAEMLEQPL
ncbi:acetate kinase, partial [Phytopseudomonas dryadis]